MSNVRGLVVLNLENNKLDGTIPDALSTWSDLEYLNMGGNKLHGSIPYVHNNTNLQVLLMRRNKLTKNDGPLGVTPYDRFGNVRLDSVDISDNNFEGPFPLSVFGHNLTYLGQSLPPSAPFL